jgi:CRISPR-associated protein Csx17
MALCRWHNDYFVLETSVTLAQIIDFLLCDWQPTPILNPWNKHSGFWSKSGQSALNAIANSTADRLEPYRDAINCVIQVKQQQVLETLPEKQDKQRLLATLRRHLPDSAVAWLDASLAIGVMGVSNAPLLGSGGNDGQFEFSATYMKQVANLIEPTGEPTPESPQLLKALLIDEPIPGLSFKEKIGQFNPIAAGGINAGASYQASSRANPWEYVLALSGSLFLTSVATRRLEQTRGEMSYPFTFRSAAVGYCSASSDVSKDLKKDISKGEVWLPLWDKAIRRQDLIGLFREGRLKVSGRTAKDGLDAARAISSFGNRRGFTEFIRYSFQKRNGEARFAIPLGRFSPKSDPQVDLLVQIDSWLDRLRYALSTDTTPASLVRALRALDTAIMTLAAGQGKLLHVLIALGQMEQALNNSLRFTLSAQKEKGLRPLRTLTTTWYWECNDDSVEYYLAACLASHHNYRQRLVQIRPHEKTGVLEWSERNAAYSTWQQGTLTSNLIRLLQRQEIEAAQSKASPENIRPQPPYAHPKAIAAWIEGNNWVNDSRLEAIARGLSLVEFKFKDEQRLRLPPKSKLPDLTPPPAYALVMATHRRVLKPDCPQHEVIPIVPGLLSALAAGNCYEATLMAKRRLKASGLRPVIGGIFEPVERTQRIAAALAFPIDDRQPGANPKTGKPRKSDVARLLENIQRKQSEETVNV